MNALFFREHSPPPEPPTFEELEKIEISEITDTLNENKKLLKYYSKKENLLKLLKHSNNLLIPLNSTKLSFSSYSSLYRQVTDTLVIFEVSLKTKKAIKKYSLSYIYDSILQSSLLIPRVYLSIIITEVQLEKSPNDIAIILLKCQKLVDQVQHPIRGFFLRDFYIKTIYNKLPNSDNNLANSAFDYRDSLNLLLNNISDMMRMWKDSQKYIFTEKKNDKKIVEKYMDVLKGIMTENMKKILIFPNLTLQLYKNEVLPSLIYQITNTKDTYCQTNLYQMILEHAPNALNIKCVNELLACLTLSVSHIDEAFLLRYSIEKFSKLDIEKNEKVKEKKDYGQIFDILQLYLQNLFKKYGKYKKMYQRWYIDKLKKLLEFYLYYMKFIVKCCPDEKGQKLKVIIHYFKSLETLINELGSQFDVKDGEILGKLFVEFLDTNVSFFKVPNFYELSAYLDNESSKKLSEKMVEFLSLNGSLIIEDFNSINEFNIIMKILQPSLVDSQDKITDKLLFKLEQITLPKIVFLINIKNPFVILDIVKQMNKMFFNSGKRKRLISMPVLASSLIFLCYKISINYDIKNSQITRGNPDDNNDKSLNIDNIVNNKEYFSSLIDLSIIKDPKEYFDLLNNCFFILKEILNTINKDNFEFAFKLYLYTAEQTSTIIFNRDFFIENCYTFLNTALDIYKNNPIEKNKYEMLKYLISSLHNLNKYIKTEKIYYVIINLKENLNSYNDNSFYCLSFIEIGIAEYLLLNSKSILTQHIGFIDKKIIIGKEFNIDTLKSLIIMVNKFIFLIEKEGDITKKGDEDINYADVFGKLVGKINDGFKYLKERKEIKADDIKKLEGFYENTVDSIKIRGNNMKNKHCEVYQEIVKECGFNK